MGIVASLLWPLSTEPDPITGLSPKDKYLVRSTWGVVKKDTVSNGLYVFEVLFAKHQDVKDMFPFARGRDWSEIRQDPRMKAHANSVMYALTSFIDALDDVPVLDAMVRKMADSHARRNVSEAHFKALGDVILEALKDKLPHLMTSDATAAWGRTYSLILKVLADQMNKTKS